MYVSGNKRLLGDFYFDVVATYNIYEKQKKDDV
jgi:hypothetical protein